MHPLHSNHKHDHNHTYKHYEEINQDDRIRSTPNFSKVYLARIMDIAISAHTQNQQPQQTWTVLHSYACPTLPYKPRPVDIHDLVVTATVGVWSVCHTRADREARIVVVAAALAAFIPLAAALTWKSVGDSTKSEINTTGGSLSFAGQGMSYDLHLCARPSIRPCPFIFLFGLEMCSYVWSGLIIVSAWPSAVPAYIWRAAHVFRCGLVAGLALTIWKKGNKEMDSSSLSHRTILRAWFAWTRRIVDEWIDTCIRFYSAIDVTGDAAMPTGRSAWGRESEGSRGGTLARPGRPRDVAAHSLPPGDTSGDASWVTGRHQWREDFLATPVQPSALCTALASFFWWSYPVLAKRLNMPSSSLVNLRTEPWWAEDDTTSLVP